MISTFGFILYIIGTLVIGAVAGAYAIIRITAAAIVEKAESRSLVHELNLILESDAKHNIRKVTNDQAQADIINTARQNVWR